MIRYMQTHYEVSEARACAVAMCSRSLYRYESRRDPRTQLRLRIREIAHVRVRYGYRRVHVLLGREGWKANHELIYRLYREEGLALRRKRPKRHVSGVHREVRTQPTSPNEAWSMDFVADQLVHGTRFRALTVVDLFTKGVFGDRAWTEPQGRSRRRSPQAHRQRERRAQNDLLR